MRSYREPGATWLGSPNFWPDRDGHDMAIQPAYVIIHTMVGTTTGANGRFQDPNSGASAHYGVGYDGSLVQWVDEKDAAWHAGNAQVNEDSIGIEHEDMGRYDDPRPDALYDTSARLVRSICLRYGIPIDRAHVRPHYEVSDSPTACPDALDFDRIIRMAATPPPQPSEVKPMTIVSSPRQPNGEVDYFTLVGDRIRHTVTDVAGKVVASDELPGSWSALISCGQYDNGTVYVRGYGTDSTLSLWDCYYDGHWELIELKP